MAALADNAVRRRGRSRSRAVTRRGQRRPCRGRPSLLWLGSCRSHRGGARQSQAVPDAVVSRCFGNPGQARWINATPATTGAGVTVAVVDAGFGNLSAEVAAGALPAGTTVTFVEQRLLRSSTAPSMALPSPRSSHQMAPSCEAAALLHCRHDRVPAGRTGHSQPRNPGS